MRLVATTSIKERTVNQFLHDEVALGVFGQGRLFQDRLEVANVAVQISGYQHLVGRCEGNNSTASARSCPTRFGGTFYKPNDLFWIRHNQFAERSPKTVVIAR